MNINQQSSIFAKKRNAILENIFCISETTLQTPCHIFSTQFFERSKEVQQVEKGKEDDLRS